MNKNQFKSTDNTPKHETLKHNPYFLSNSSMNSIMQLRTINTTVFQSNFTTLNTLGVNGVIQLQAINAWDGTHQWYSTEAFDTKHYCEIPDTDQEWLDWRLSRWPGFSVTLPACTLITGDLNDALRHGHYDNYSEQDGSFKVTVRCNARSVQPYNSGNALTLNNLRLVDHNEVVLGGFVNPGNRRFNHLFYGI